MISQIAAFNESRIDDTLYTDATTFARDTPWLNTPMLDYSSAGMVLFAVLILAAWWIGRRSTPSVMAAAIGVPIAAVAAYLVNDAIKWLVSEQRPCHALAGTFLLEQCPPVADYSFPSNHAAVAAAMAAAFFLVDRRLGLVATAAAVIMGFSRVYVGAHYPHDVAVGFLIGAVVGTGTVIAVSRYGTTLIERMSTSRVGPLLTVR
ncbi:phosphatase PAP2 family protein [Rhodococcus qingshengii]|uniref:phosphatase PAP2 family protein n=1 Tax=Rhodococcus qingshengii TaxID=334542 RepID=UPI0024BB59F9|nr:phosphatase PAP2 family protein [Rhodococcus qingshengii]MDJ0441404.1 phosphatase PAP2 family protein [Rhodococcus qingshengii]